jgi:hypothetical protein
MSADTLPNPAAVWSWQVVRLSPVSWLGWASWNAAWTQVNQSIGIGVKAPCDVVSMWSSTCELIHPKEK